uniref:F-box domain-containing protein n=1 Tax=Biomphalaria glabrata TaxID=6526 RepID=A0A2C9KUG3_BIOGL
MLTPSVVKMDDKKQAELAGDGQPRPQIQTVCAELGRLAPSVVQMEDNIQAELAGDGTPLPRPQNQICDIMSLNERVCHEWKNLPLLVIMNIFSYLTDNEMRIFSQVCQSWYTKFLLIYWCTNLTLQLKLIDNCSLDRVTGLISRKIRQLEISYV